MNILLLAPQPFYTERGTPIAVLNLATALSGQGHHIDILTFPHGRDIHLPNTRLLRTGRWLPLGKHFPVGFSFRKIGLDAVMLFRALYLARKNNYDVIHAVEESVFIALACTKTSRSKVIYDMDSSMSDQLIERYPSLSFIHTLLDKAEGFAVKRSDLVLTVCQALADKCKHYAGNTVIKVIEDVADNQSPDKPSAVSEVDDLSTVLVDYPTKCLYVGNLEHYQGVGLVIEALAEAQMPSDVGFIVIGGLPADIDKYSALADSLGVKNRVAFLGPRPLQDLPSYLQQADILVSPRLKGINTPMKIYTYLGSKKPIVATNIASHTQVLTDETSCLVAPNPPEMAQGITKITNDTEYKNQLSQAAFQAAEQRFSYHHFEQRIGQLYQELDDEA